MRLVKNTKKTDKRMAYIMRGSMSVLTAVLIVLFFGIMSMVSSIQGTARVVNYAGLVRGCTQRRKQTQKAIVNAKPLKNRYPFTYLTCIN